MATFACTCVAWVRMLSKGDSGAKIGCPALTGKRWSAVVVEGVTEEVTRVPLY